KGNKFRGFKMKKTIITLSLAILILCTLQLAYAAGPTAIRVAPPAPVFTDAERQAELARRRAAVAEKMADNSVMVLFSAEPKIYTNDVDYVFRQENNLYYLTAYKQTGASLIIRKKGGDVSYSFFIRKRNPQMETWNGKMLS